MNKIGRGVLVLLVGLVIGVLLWNVYLMNQVDRLEAELQDQQMINDMLEGDNDVLSYDLITARDSLRILNNSLQSDSL